LSQKEPSLQKKVFLPKISFKSWGVGLFMDSVLCISIGWVAVMVCYGFWCFNINRWSWLMKWSISISTYGWVSCGVTYVSLLVLRCTSSMTAAETEGMRVTWGAVQHLIRRLTRAEDHHEDFRLYTTEFKRLKSCAWSLTNIACLVMWSSVYNPL
jgi:hypothetical protein